MLVKLTHKGKPTIINPRLVISMYMDTDQRSGEYKVKIVTATGSIFVDEDLKTIHELFNNAIAGEVPQEYDYSVPTIDERMDRRYNHERAENYSTMNNERPMRRRMPYYENNRY